MYLKQRVKMPFICHFFRSFLNPPLLIPPFNKGGKEGEFPLYKRGSQGDFTFNSQSGGNI